MKDTSWCDNSVFRRLLSNNFFVLASCSKTRKTKLFKY